jgi:A/G-specific adenine glycosylase
VLKEKRGRGFGPERQDAACGSFAQLDGTRDPRGFGSGDLDPAQNQCRIGEPGALKRGSGRDRRVATDRIGARASWRFVGLFVRLFVPGRLRHAWSMPPAPLSKQNRNVDRAAKLLAWYDIHRRELPWRARGGRRADPYHVWLSEIMLQQTTVQAVGKYYAKFLKAWPTVKDLSDAPQDDVLAAWAGLGYYARARNLHAAAKLVANEMGGIFPDTAEGLRALPGVGTYTSGAIAAIAFDRREAAVDANAERVLARLFAVDEPMPAAKARLRALGHELVPQMRAGDFAQALMDLGSLICTPKRPNCTRCPWSSDCKARELGIQDTLPTKAPKSARPLKRGAAFVARDRSGAVLLVKRPERGLLGAMLQPPLGPWTSAFPSAMEASLQAPFRAKWQKLAGIVRHGFTHFELEVEVYLAVFARRPLTGDTSARWVHDLSSVALPTVMKKVIEHALAAKAVTTQTRAYITHA